VLVVLDLVAGFQAFGTLLAGVPLLLPAAAARCWAQRIGPLAGLSIGFAWRPVMPVARVYHLNVPSGRRSPVPRHSSTPFRLSRR